MRHALKSKLHGKKLRVVLGSDCIGAGGPEQAWASVARVLDKLDIAKLDLPREGTFGSEAHDKVAKHAHTYIGQNLNIQVLFLDMVERAVRMLQGHRSFPTVFRSQEGTQHETGGSHALPEPYTIDNYSVGFECQDLSLRNEQGKSLGLECSPEQYLLTRRNSLGRSERTLMASLVTIKKLQPRTVFLENVRGSARVHSRFFEGPVGARRMRKNC